MFLQKFCKFILVEKNLKQLKILIYTSKKSEATTDHLKSLTCATEEWSAPVKGSQEVYKPTGFGTTFFSGTTSQCYACFLKINAVGEHLKDCPFPAVLAHSEDVTVQWNPNNYEQFLPDLISHATNRAPNFTNGHNMLKMMSLMLTSRTQKWFTKMSLAWLDSYWNMFFKTTRHSTTVRTAAWIQSLTMLACKAAEWKVAVDKRIS